jgi:hypothetical protein
MPSQEITTLVIISTAGFFLLGLITVYGFYLIGKQLEHISAIQAAIFLHARQQFANFDAKLNELLGGN